MINQGSPRVLLLGLLNWFGAPRLPKVMRRAGFHVISFGFPGLLLQRSQAVDETVLVPEALEADALVQALLNAVERSGADVIIPTDATSILLLHAAALEAERGEQPSQVRAALARSLCAPEHRAAVRSRKAMARLADDAGVLQPAHAEVFAEADAFAFAAQHGYPLVLKEEESVAGFGVSICKDEAELKAALMKIQQRPEIFAAGLLAQSFVEGRVAMRVVVADGGSVRGGLSAFKLHTWPGPTGPSTCVELMEHEGMKESAARLLRALGYNGFASLDYIVDGSGRAHLIELNPRPTPIAHLGERYGGCLFRHLHESLTGKPSGATEPRGLPAKVALFPQEWVRDEHSPHLASDTFHDVPWDEPDLVEALMVMARAQMRWMAYRRGDTRNEALRLKLSQLEAG